MFNKYYQNMDTTQEFTHVMGWQMTETEFSKFAPKLMKRITKYGRKVSMFFMPAKGVEGFKACGMSCVVQCDPSIHNEVLASVDNINF